MGENLSTCGLLTDKKGKKKNEGEKKTRSGRKNKEE